MSISSVTTAASQTTTAAQSTSVTSSANSADSTSASSSGSGGSSSSKTVVSEVSITLDGVTTTTITYADGSSEVTRTAAASDSSGKGAPSYNAQGASGNVTSGSTGASSQSVTV
ncbi:MULTISPECIES: hypothetical protein [unclassified Bradyrhizobium]|uniref:hypothetical protein n=1 Tax=unclassified Bradyrhizobium TaxID=2631580 RepID=UPI0028E6377B|nr:MULTISPECIES: hypothetical protein [unclassified Bradyrhizobium]